MKAEGKIIEKAISEGESQNGPWSRASFTVGDKKFSTFDESLIKEFNPGDYVEIVYGKSKDGKYNNITEMKKIAEPEATKPDKVMFGKEIIDKIEEAKEQSVWDRKDLRIAKMNALTNSASLLELIGVPKGITKDEILVIVKEMAEELLKYIYE